MGSEYPAQTFEYEPVESEDPKIHIDLCETKEQVGEVQIVGEDGANNLHSHQDADGFWMVLGGKARFYTAGDEVIGEFGPYEGVQIPRDFPYWFESAGDEKLEILHVVSIDPELSSERVDHEGEKEERNKHFDGTVRRITDPRDR